MPIGFGTKFANPGTLPTAQGYGVAFSGTGNAIAVAHDESPYVTAWPWSGSGFGTKFTNPGILPAGNGDGVTFTVAGDAISVAHWNSPFVTIYPWSGSGFGTKFTNPGILPPSSIGRGPAFTTAGDAFAIGGIVSPHLVVYPWSGSGFGTKFTNPGTIPTGSRGDVAFTTAGDAIAAVGNAIDYIDVYQWSGSGFGTRFTGPTGLPFYTLSSVDFTDTDNAIAVGDGVAWPWSGSGFGTKFTDPSPQPVGTNGLVFVPIADAIAFATYAGAYISAYEWSASGFGTKYAGASSPPPSGALGVAFTATGDAVAVAHAITPFVSVYTWNAPVAPSCSAVSVDYNGLTRTGPNNTPWFLEFTGSDNPNNYEIWTDVNRTGTIVDFGIAINGINIISIDYNASGLMSGIQTLYLSLNNIVGFGTDCDFILNRDNDNPTDPDFGASVLTIFFVYEWRDHLFNFISDITPMVIQADIKLDNDQQVTRTARFKIDPADLPEGFNIETERISVNAIVVQNAVRTIYTLGLFTLDVGTLQFTDAGNPLDFSLDPVPPKVYEFWDVEGSDMGTHLQEAKVPSPYTIDAGINYITAIESLIDTVLFYDFTGTLRPLKHVFPAQTEVTPFDYTWGPGTPKLQIINEMLMAINWYPAWADERGTIRSRLQILPSSEIPDIEYSTELEPRMIVAPFSKSKVRSQFPNQVVVLIDDPRRAPEYSFRENYGILSSISVVNVDPNLKEIDGSKMLAATVAKDLADFTLGVANAMASEASLTTDFDPRRKAHETYRLTISGVENGTKWKVFGWSISMTNGSVMIHKIGKADIIQIQDVVS